jgi:hypothetical protein
MRVISLGEAHTAIYNATYSHMTATNTNTDEPSDRPPMRVDLRKLLLLKQRQLNLDLETGRVGFDHPGEKGDASENAWRAQIENFLPKRYAVSTGFVIDSRHERSEQIDVLIHDRHFCPAVFEQDGKLYVPAESVFAALEIKQELSAGTIDYTAGKLESVRRLHRTSTVIVDRGERREPRQPFHIIGGLLTFKSSWNPPLGDPLRRALLAARDESRRLDIGCALNDGAFEAAYPGDEGIQLDISDPDGAWIYLQTSLFRLLQAIGSPMAIDLKEYTRPIEAQRETPTEIHIDPAESPQ